MKGLNKTFFVIIIIVFLIFGVILKLNFKNITKRFDNSIIQAKEGNMKLTTVFEHNGNIPSKYTCDGEDAAPELIVSDVPQGAKELVLIVDDPDAPMGTWIHWVVYNLPPSTKKIEYNSLPPETKQGMTDFGRVGWGGPCPPSGTHRYFFKLYAIDKTLVLPQGATKAQVEKEINGNIIEKAELIGLYKRNS